MTGAVEELAQRALGDVFEQLERIGTTGRERCRGSTYTVSPPSPLTRAEALALIRVAENALDYARVHLDYLPGAKSAEEPPRPVFKAGDRVRIADETNSWPATFARYGEDGLCVVTTPGGPLTVDARDVFYDGDAEAAE